MELADIQEALKKRPLDKEEAIEMITSAIGPWKSRYGSRTPPDLEVLIERLQAVVPRLRGHGDPTLADAPAPERVLSRIGKLDAALVEISYERRRLEEDGPRLEERLVDLTSIHRRQVDRVMAEGHRKIAEENTTLAEKHTNLVAQAEKRATVLTQMMTPSTQSLKASEETDLYARR